IVGVDPRAHAPGARHFRLGPLEGGGQRRSRRRLLHGGGLRGDVAGGAERAVGTPGEPLLPGGTRLAEPVRPVHVPLDGPGDVQRARPRPAHLGGLGGAGGGGPSVRVAPGAAAARTRGGVVSAERRIVFEDVSKFYGEVLGVNRVTLSLPPGITSLVGPNGSGKTTLMNLMTGLIRPTRGRLSVLGLASDDCVELGRRVGYCTQFDSFPRGVTGRSFVRGWLGLHGRGAEEADRLTAEALDRVGMTEAADRKVGAYSKGMRQRIRLALALSHRPEVLVLDEPLNGLDPMARAECLALFTGLAGEGLHVVISSHILHEVDRVSDHVVLLSHGYVVAEGQIHDVRTEVTDHPMQMLVRCDRPHVLAAG